MWAFAVHEALDQSGALLGPLLVAAMVAISGYRLGFAVLALPGALALVTLAWLRRAVPVPAAYEHAAALRQPARADASAAAAARFPRRFWLYTAFTAVSMLGFGTFGVLAYHLQVRHVLAPALIPVVYATAMGAAAIAALASGRLYDRVGLRALVIAPVLAATVPFRRIHDDTGARVARQRAVGSGDGDPRVDNARRRRRPRAARPPRTGLRHLHGRLRVSVARRQHADRCALYGQSITAVIAFTATTQALALAVFIPLAARPRRGAPEHQKDAREP